MKHYTVKLKIVELETDNYHITAKARIGGTPVNMVIDTGASHTCFDLNFIQSLQDETDITDNDGMNVGIGCSDFESKLSVIPHFVIGKLDVPDYSVVLLDMKHINDAYNSMNIPPVQGILGSDFFVKYKAVIDYQKKEMTLWSLS